MVFCINKFLSYFCVVFSTDEGDLGLDYSSLDLPENKSDVLGAMDRLYEMYRQEFQSVLEKISDIPEFHMNFSFYTNATLARCMSLFGTGNYYHFVLVCTLVREIIFTSFDSEKCYSFAEIGLQCLLIMYDRCRERPSNAVDGYQALATYCRNLNPDLLLKEYDSFLIRSLNYVHDLNFQLTDYEWKKINTCLNSILMGDTDHEVIEATKKKLFESENSINDGISVEDPVERMDIAEEVCPVCRRRCFKFVEKLLDLIRIR